MEHRYLNEEERSDAYIIDFVTNVKKKTLKQDLWRHRWMIIKQWLRIAKYRAPLLDLYCWCYRLEQIIEKQKNEL